MGWAPWENGLHGGWRALQSRSCRGAKEAGPGGGRRWRTALSEPGLSSPLSPTGTQGLCFCAPIAAGGGCEDAGWQLHLQGGDGGWDGGWGARLGLLSLRQGESSAVKGWSPASVASPVLGMRELVGSEQEERRK